VTGESDAQADARVQAIIAANQSAAVGGRTADALSSSEPLAARHLVANMPLPGAARRLH